MNRDVKFILFAIALPPTAGFLLAFATYAFSQAIGFDRSADEIFTRSYSYIGGIVAGWWVFGGDQ